MPKVNINEDLSRIFDILWNRSDVDMWSFDTYKGFAYVLECSTHRVSYFSLVDELTSKVQEKSSDWQVYFMKLLISTMKEDNRVPARSRESLPECNSIDDIPVVIPYIRQNKNAMMYANDIATNLYDDAIRMHKSSRKKDVISYLTNKHCKDPEDVYNRLLDYEEVLRPFYRFIQNPNASSMCPEIVVSLCEELKAENWQKYILWLEYKENPQSIRSKYKHLVAHTRAELYKSQTEQLKRAHNIAMSGIYEDFKVFKTFDKDTAYELGCDEYVESEWRSEVIIDDNLDKFLSVCYLGKCIKYDFEATMDGKTVEIKV